MLSEELVIFTSFIADGIETDLMAPPIFGAAQFQASDLTEVRGRLIADLCGARAVISQFNRGATVSPADSVDAAANSRVVAFHNPGNGTIAYKHIVKVFAGGRAVSEQEAIDMARTNATRFFLDVDQLEMKVTTDADPRGRNASIPKQVHSSYRQMSLPSFRIAASIKCPLSCLFSTIGGGSNPTLSANMKLLCFQIT